MNPIDYNKIIEMMQRLNKRIEERCEGEMTPILTFTTDGYNSHFTFFGDTILDSDNDYDFTDNSLETIEEWLVDEINSAISDWKSIGEI